MGLLSRLFGGGAVSMDGADTLYDGVMAAALRPELYTSGMMTDTFEGRFQSVSFHSALVMRRLRAAGEPGKIMADALYKRVFSGFDYAYREKGIGDSSIARKVRKLGEEFFGLARALDSALESEAREAGVMDALTRNGLGGKAPDALRAYVIAADSGLTAAEDASLLSGAAPWPAPPAIT